VETTPATPDLVGKITPLSNAIGLGFDRSSGTQYG
jgi:hypothetical protein